MDLVVDFLHGLLMKDARWVVVVRGKEVYINKEVMMETMKLPHIVKNIIPRCHNYRPLKI